jgi:hypothetical protein
MSLSRFLSTYSVQTSLMLAEMGKAVKFVG